MSEAVPIVESTGTAPATPGASPTVETPVETQVQAQPTPEVAAAAPVIPDKYEFKLPEGQFIDEGLVTAITPILKELSMTQEGASKLVGAVSAFAVADENAKQAKFESDFKQWEADNLAAAKKMWGNDYDANLAISQSAIARFLSNDGKVKLKNSGLGNDPEFLKAFYQVGKMIQEDRPISNVSPPDSRPSKLFTKSVPSGVN